MSRRCQMGQSVRRMRMWRFLKYGRCLRMTRLARFAPDKLSAGRVRGRPQAQPFQSQLLKLFLVGDLHLLNLRGIRESMIERHALVAERRFAVLVEPDDDQILGL